MGRISDALREAIEASGQSRYRIAQGTGISESMLSRFMAGHPIKTDTVDRLAEYLGLDLVDARKRRKGR